MVLSTDIFIELTWSSLGTGRITQCCGLGYKAANGKKGATFEGRKRGSNPAPHLTGAQSLDKGIQFFEHTLQRHTHICPL